MKNLILYNSIFISAFVIVAGCGNPSTDTGASSEDGSMIDSAQTDTTPISEVGVYLFNYTIMNLPAPVSVLEQFAEAGLPVNTALLNPYKNVGNYESAVSKAFNFGIYGIDLAYLVVNKKSIDVLSYYSSSRKLAQELNMAEIFDSFTQRFESNIDNKDSLMRIIDDAYASSDKYLRSNERLETASQILAATWLESQYITVNLLKNIERNAENDTLFHRVWEQKFHLDNISKIFNELKGNEESLLIKSRLDGLLSVYAELKDSQSVNKEFIEKLAERIEKVRKSITG